ncbi:MAG: fumarylacetoacetate hydrolase family protein [Pseudomonadota bacterium]
MIADGDRPAGHKIGFTSVTMQKMYGMTGPHFGILMDRMFLEAGMPVPIGHLSDTRAEPELAFELGRSLSGPGVTLADALRAKANDSLADNAGAGYVVFGEAALDPNDLDLASINLSMDVDGILQSAPAGDVMGNPAEPLAWLANKLPELGGLGGALAAGDIVITGAPVKSVAVKPGSQLTSDFGSFGRIDIHFT